MGFKPDYLHITDYRLRFALEYIYEQYGHVCKIDRPLIKFGRRTDLGTRLDVREYGKVFRPQIQLPASSTGSNVFDKQFGVLPIVKPNSDVRVTGEASTTAVSASAFLSGYLAKII